MSVRLVPVGVDVDGSVAAVVDEETSWSWDDFERRTAALAASMADRYETGQRVLGVLGNSRWFLLVSFACTRAGLVFVPVNNHLTLPELSYLADDCGPACVVVDRSRVDVLPAARAWAADVLDESWLEEASTTGATAPERPAGRTMLYTSGTTGRPKGVSRGIGAAPPAAAARYIADLAQWFGYAAGGRHLVICPLYHGAPHSHATQALARGQTVIVASRFDAEQFLSTVEHERITSTHVVPTMFVRLLALPEIVRARYDVSSLELVMHGAAACAEPVKRSMIEWLGPIVTEYYGSTEGSGPTRATSEEWLARPGTVGRAHPTVRVCAVNDSGEDLPVGQTGVLYFSSPQGPVTYLGDSAKTAAARRADDSFTVGDVGHVDADGYLFITGRVTELVISGGVNVYPAEVESVLAAHPDVQEVAVVGLPDPEWGERLHAVVVPRPGCEVTLDTLIPWAGRQLAAMKLPRSLELRTGLPYGPTGKVDKRRLADEAAVPR